MIQRLILLHLPGTSLWIVFHDQKRKQKGFVYLVHIRVTRFDYDTKMLVVDEVTILFFPKNCIFR